MRHNTSRGMYDWLITYWKVTKIHENEIIPCPRLQDAILSTLFCHNTWDSSRYLLKVSLTLSLPDLLKVFHTILMMLVWRIWSTYSGNPLTDIFPFSYNLSAQYCINNVRVNGCFCCCVCCYWCSIESSKKTKIDLLSLSIKFCCTSYVILMKILSNWRNDNDNPVNTELITNIQRPAVKFKAEGNES